MADFIYLFRGGDVQSLSPEAMQKHMQAWGSWIETLGKEGKFKGGDPLGNEGRVLEDRDEGWGRADSFTCFVGAAQRVA